MKLILLLVLFQSLSKAQIVLNGNTVSLPKNTYNSIVTKYYLCDSIIIVKDSIIINQDSIIKSKNNTIYNKNLLLESKDITIKDLRKEYNLVINKKAPKWWERKETWISALVGLLIGVALSR